MYAAACDPNSFARWCWIQSMNYYAQKRRSYLWSYRWRRGLLCRAGPQGRTVPRPPQPPLFGGGLQDPRPHTARDNADTSLEGKDRKSQRSLSFLSLYSTQPVSPSSLYLFFDLFQLAYFNLCK